MTSLINVLRSKRVAKATIVTAAIVVTACAGYKNVPRPNAEASVDISASNNDEMAEHELIRYYIGKLSDRRYVEIYGDADNPRPWYTAAEALGDIGAPAVPALIERLATPEPYELKLVLYALMLASQDPDLLARTAGKYLQLGTVLTEDGNQDNRQLALEWWQRYKHLW